MAHAARALLGLVALCLAVPLLVATGGSAAAEPVGGSVTAVTAAAAAPRFTWNLPATARVGSTVTSTVRVTPARPARQVVVEQRVNGVWQYVGRVIVRDEATVSFVQLASGPSVYRLNPTQGADVVRQVRGTGRAPAAPTRRLSVTSDGSPVAGHSTAASASDDGAFAAYTSHAENLTTRRDTNDESDVFLRNTATGAVRVVSLGRDGATGRGWSAAPAISGDARFVAFVSRAPDLVRGDGNRRPDVFVWSRATGATTRVGAHGREPSLSRDGRFVAFTSLVGERSSVQVRDRRTGALTTISRRARAASAPSISADGRLVAFQQGGRVVLHDRSTGISRVVSTTAVGEPARGARPQLSADGSTVAFESSDARLDARRRNQVFRHDLATGTTTMLSTREGRPGDATSELDAISADGTVVLFTSAATLVADDVDDFGICESESDCVSNDADFDAYVADADGVVTMASRSSTGAPSELETRGSDLTADGGQAFFSSRDALVPGQPPRDELAPTDVFVRDLR